MEPESDDDTNFNCCSWYSHKRIDTGFGGLGNKRTIRDNPNYGINKIGKNMEESPGDMRFTVTQTPEKLSA